MAMQLFVDGEVLAVQLNQKHSLSCSLLEISVFSPIRSGRKLYMSTDLCSYSDMCRVNS